MRKRIALFSLITWICFSCSQKKSVTEYHTPPVPFVSTPLDSVYTTLRPAVQTFSIDNRKTIKIKGTHGTEMLIPSNCFVDADGNEVKTLTLEVIEALSLPDFVTSGLVTLSDEKLLLSNGMLYINARSGAGRLQLKKGVSLSVTMPTMTINSGYQLFTGDGRNWKADSTMTAGTYAFPLSLLYPEGKNTFWYCILYSGDDNQKTFILDTSIVNVTNPKYENTIIATEEFHKRIPVLTDMMFRISYLTGRDYYLDKVGIEKQKFNYDLWRVYFDHPQRSFRESDSIARTIYVDYFKANKEKLAAFCAEVNRHKKRNLTFWSDTSDYFDFRKQSLEAYFMEPLLSFPRADKELEIINDYGVNLDAPNAYELLASKGVSESSINQTLTCHFQRQAMIRQLQRAKENAVQQKNIDHLYATTVFSVSELGWINCDRFFDDPSAGKATILVSNGSATQLDYMDCSLVIPDLKVRLSAYPKGRDQWSFTKNDGAYTRLPIGREAVITGVSLKHDSVFFAHEKIKIRDGLSIVLPMHYIEKGRLKDSLKAVLN